MPDTTTCDCKTQSETCRFGRPHLSAKSGDVQCVNCEDVCTTERMKTVVIEWVETSCHRAAVNIPAHVDLDDVEGLADHLGNLDNPTFRSLERSDIGWSMAPPDFGAETFLAAE